MSGTTRRVFLGSLAATGVAGMAARAAEPEKVRMAVIGLKSRGLDVLKNFAKDPGAEIVAVCDIDDAMIPPAVRAVEQAGGSSPRVEKDFRKLLDDKSIDGVIIATPDHWHALMTVMACQAKKDVYVEKPASHNVVEGRRMVQAARKYERVVQVGTQRRSTPHIIEAVEYVRSGKLGKVGFARAWIMQKRKPIGKGQPGEVPAGVDYALWQGPALDRPFYANRFHYNWHWFWNWGTGELGNNGIHGLDVARWGLNVDAPTAVVSGGGKYVFDDDQEVPDTQIVTWEFSNACITWEHRMWTDRKIDDSGFGVSFQGDAGTLVIGEKGWKVYGADGAEGKAKDGQSAHIANFLDCVRTRKNPNADIEIGHVSTRLCHLGNIAHRVGRRIRFEAETESIPGDAEAGALLTREYGPRFQMPAEV